MDIKILVIDDEATTAVLLEAALRKASYQVRTASNGRQGLELINQDRPHLVISDVVMPDMDGFSFFKELKLNDKTASIPIIILTSREKMVDTFSVLGVNAFLVKPVDTEALLEQIKAILGNLVFTDISIQAKNEAVNLKEEPKEVKKQEAPPVAESKQNDDFKKSRTKKFLVAGDSMGVLEIMVTQLQGKQYQALKILKVSELLDLTVSLEPDVIIVDVLFNDVSAGEIIQKLRKNRSFGQKSIIVFSYLDKERLGNKTAHQRMAEIQKAKASCMEAGATGSIGEFEEAAFIPAVMKYFS